jgi:putative flippase GtrA
MPDYFWNLVRFALLSLLSFGLTVGLTVLSVQVFGWNPLFAHILTLLIAMTVNAWLLVVFVFPNEGMDRRRFVGNFVVTSIVLRSCEWLAFAVSVEWFGLDYRLSIIIINPVFAFVKFLVLRNRAYSAKP